MYEWHDKKYLGAAHGLTGILHLLMQFPKFMSEGDNTKYIRGSVDFILSLVKEAKGNFPSREGGSFDLAHWCHGPTAAALCLLQAYNVFKDSQYLAGAKLAVDQVWNKGLLLKGPGLCHGCSGNGYAQLATFRATKDPMYLNRAIQFALKYADPAYSTKMRTPDSPYSLYVGMAGMVCLCADLLDPINSAFPAFEFPPKQKE